MGFGLDYAWSKPDLDEVKENGYEFVCRYLSRDPSKDLSAHEALDLAAHGIWMCVVWETTASRAKGTRNDGVVDAKEAVRLATALGMPQDRPIYFAVDYDMQRISEVTAYFQGVLDVLPKERVGVYGGIKAVNSLITMGLATWSWQTYAWSGGKWFIGNHIEQYQNGVTFAGGNVDLNRSKKPDYGQWMPGRSPSMAKLDDEDYQNIARAVWEKDGIVDSPPSRRGDPPNTHWKAESYLAENYRKLEEILAKLDAHSNAPGSMELSAEAVAEAILARWPGDFAKQVVNELAARLTS